MELILVKGEVAGPLTASEVLVALGIALIYVAVVLVVVTSETRRDKARSRR